MECFGVRLGVRVNEPGLLPAVVERLPAGWKPARSPVVDQLYSVRHGGEPRRTGVRPYHLMYLGYGRVGRTLDWTELLDEFELHAQLLVAATTRRMVFVHAGAVEWRGQGIVIPGSTFSGKSTLVAALVRAGAAYYSDEYAVLDAEGRLHPFPKPLHLRKQTGEPGTRHRAEEIGGRTGRKPVPVGLVLITQYREGARWRPRRLTPGQATLALLAHTVPARRDPERSLAFLKTVAGSAEALKSARGDADDSAKTFLLAIEQGLAGTARRPTT